MKRTLLLFFMMLAGLVVWAQPAADSIPPLFEKSYIWQTGNSVPYQPDTFEIAGKESWFYLFCALALYLGFFRSSYTKYLSTLFKVFFNSSLRQSQLTDQLQQARLPSLLLNAFFIMVTGVLLYITMRVGGIIITRYLGWYLLACAGLVALIYVVKVLVLKLTGLMSGFTEQTNVYIYIIFLLNKVAGILLFPILILIIFGPEKAQLFFFWAAWILLGFLFLLRYYRSYGLLQNKLRISRFHFALFITGVEILPLLLFWKAAMIYLGKNL